MIDSFSQSMQGNGSYPGIDFEIESLQLKGIKLVVSAEALNQDGKYMKGNYYLEPKEILEMGINAVSICQKAQIAAFYSSQLYGGMPQYKTKLVAYTLDGIDYEFGKALANSQYGKGELHQIVIPNKDSAEKIDLNNISSLNLNKEDEELLSRLINEYKPYINKDGTIDLNNTAITKKVYDVMELKTQIHKYKLDYLCTLKEYENELNGSRNQQNLKELESEIKGIEKSIKDAAASLDKAYEKLDKKLDVQSMDKNEINYFLDKQNYIKRDIVNLIEYEKIKIRYLEEQYKIEDKLNTSEMEHIKATKFIPSDKVDSELAKRYELYSTGSFDNMGRDQIHFKKVDKNTMKLLHSLSIKDNLNKMLINLKDEDIKAICLDKIKSIDKEIKNNRSRIKDFNNIDNEYKTKILYLEKKVNEINRYSDDTDNNWIVEKDCRAFRQYYDNKNKFEHSSNTNTLININSKINEFINKVDEIKNCKTEMDKECYLVASYTRNLLDLENINKNQKHIDHLKNPNLTTLQKTFYKITHSKEIESYNLSKGRINIDSSTNIDTMINDINDKIKVNQIDFKRLFRLSNQLESDNNKIKKKIMSFKTWQYDDLENLESSVKEVDQTGEVDKKRNNDLKQGMDEWKHEISEARSKQNKDNVKASPTKELKDEPVR